MTYLPLPSVEELNLPEEAVDWTRKRSGLIIVAGSNGSRKNATLASLVRYVGEQYFNRPVRVIDRDHEYQYNEVPNADIESIYLSDTGLPFIDALRIAYSAIPDVLAIDKINTQQEFLKFYAAADTGQLVMTTLHAQSCTHAVQRLLCLVADEVESKANAGVGIVAQVNVPRVNSSKHLTVYETLTIDQEVSKLIMNRDIAGIQRYQDTRKQSMEHQLVRALIDGEVPCWGAYEEARRAEAFKKILEQEDV